MQNDQSNQQKGNASGAAGEQAQAKKLVHYRELVFCVLGRSAMLMPCDHHSALVSNTKLIFTSQVVAGPDEEGRFETMNTVYAPKPKI